MRIFLFILTSLLVFSCQSNKKIDVSESTKSTIRLIDSIVTSPDIIKNPSRNEEILALKRNQYENATINQTNLFANYVEELYRSGAFLSAAQFMQKSFEGQPIRIEQLNDQTKVIYETLAKGYLMIAMDINKTPIIYPVKGKQLHRDPQYIDAAEQFYSMLHKKYPLDRNYLWKINLCHILRGTYPGAINSEDLVLLSPLQINGSPTTFIDIAESQHLTVKRNAGASAFLDFDKDGDKDLIVTSHDLLKEISLYEYRNFKYHLKGDSLGLKNLTGGYNCSVVDFNNDGYKDVFIGRGKRQGAGGRLPNSLLMNIPQKGFTDIAVDNGLHINQPTEDVIWSDIDHDGDLDLFNAHGKSTEFIKDVIFENIDGLSFKDETEKFLPRQFWFDSSSAVFTDIDGDGWQDLIVCIADRPNYVYLNKEGVFKIKKGTGLEDHFFTSGLLSFDYDNDGDVDIFYSGFFGPDAGKNFEIEMSGKNPPVNELYINNGEGKFTKSDQLGELATVTNITASSIIDIDNDGFLDIYLCTNGLNLEDIIPNRLFQNMGGQGFKDVSGNSGTAVMGKTSSISVSDINYDGDSDFFVNGGGYFSGDKSVSYLFDNRLKNTNHWIGINLEGVQNNRDGIGATITISGKNEAGQARSIFREVHTGNSSFSYDLSTPIGLGGIRTIDVLTVKWPMGQEETFNNVAVDRYIYIKEGVGEIPVAN